MTGLRYRAAWRWHFFAGVFVVPFLLVLAITGLVMVYYTSVQTPLGERLFVSPSDRAATAPTQQLAVAVAALPGAVVTQYIPPRGADIPVQFELTRTDNTYVIDIDPYRNTVLRVVDKNTTPYALAQRIHSTLLIGEVGDVLLEIVAGLTLLLLATGPYMWFQQRQRPPVEDSSRRRRWRRWHLLTGLYASVLLCFFLLSGLAWTDVWGGKFVQPWGSFPAQKWGPIALSGVNHGALNHGAASEVPWGLEQTPLPASTQHTRGAVPDAHVATDLDTVDEQARALGFGPRFRINLPQGADGVYTISSTSMTGDTDVPGDERTVHIDRHSGEIVAEVSYADYSLLAKSMAVGIAVHQANMGRWNIALNVLACLALIFLCVSGTLLWWLRRPPRASWMPVAPRIAGLPLRNGFTALLLLMGLAFPLLGATLLSGLIAHTLIARYRR